MPFDSLIVAAAVVAMFVVFAGVLAWGDAQTRPARETQGNRGPKRRAF